MTQGRIEMNAVMLPNGKVLAVGGSVNDEDASTESLNADLYDPGPTMSLRRAPNAYARLYHSNALLLPDATVWFAGGNPAARQLRTAHGDLPAAVPVQRRRDAGHAADDHQRSGDDFLGRIVYGHHSGRGKYRIGSADAAGRAHARLRYGPARWWACRSPKAAAPDRHRAAQRQHRAAGILHAVPAEQQWRALGGKIYQAGRRSARTDGELRSIPRREQPMAGRRSPSPARASWPGPTVKLGGTSATGVTVVSSTSITATTPAHAAGAVSVVVTNTDAQSGTLNNGYTYTATNPAPTVSAITPERPEPPAGGTAVTITGTGFLAGATVSLGGTAATGVTVVNSTSITATTAAHAAGAVNVVVTNTDAQSGTLTNGYHLHDQHRGGGPIAFVQVNAATPQTATASVPVTFGLAQTAGQPEHRGGGME